MNGGMNEWIPTGPRTLGHDGDTWTKGGRSRLKQAAGGGKTDSPGGSRSPVPTALVLLVVHAHGRHSSCPCDFASTGVDRTANVLQAGDQSILPCGHLLTGPRVSSTLSTLVHQQVWTQRLISVATGLPLSLVARSSGRTTADALVSPSSSARPSVSS